MEDRDPFQVYLAKMAAVGFQPSSVLGQNFRLDPSLHRWIAEQAGVAEEEGAMFGVMRSASGDPPDFQAQPGEWIWIQLMTRSGRGAAEFYSRVAGYRIVDNTTEGRLSDYVLTSQGYARTTVRNIPDSAKEVEPTWLLFVRVATLGESIAKTRELGGTILLEPKPEFLGGRVAVGAEPTGAPVGLFEWSDTLVKKVGER